MTLSLAHVNNTLLSSTVDSMYLVDGDRGNDARTVYQTQRGSIEEEKKQVEDGQPVGHGVSTVYTDDKRVLCATSETARQRG